MGAGGHGFSFRNRSNTQINNNVAAKAAQRPVVEEVVNLNATPFASTIDSPSIDIEPVTVVGSRPEPKESLIPKDIRGGAYDSRIPYMIWDAAKGMNVVNPSHVAPDYSGLDYLKTLGPDFKIDFSNFAEVSKNLQKQETEKYGLIAPPEGFDAYADIASAAQKIYLDEANKMIKDFGVDKKDAEQWYSDILKFTKDRPVYGLDVNPELKPLAAHKNRLKNEGYVKKTNAWINELEGLRNQDTASFTSSFNDMPTINKLQYLYSAYQKGDITRNEYKQNFKNTVNANYDPQLNPNTKIIIDIKGNDYLVDANNVYGKMTDPFFLSRGASYADDSLYFPSKGVSEGEWLQSIGRGQKSAEDKIYKTLEGGTASFFLNNPVTQIAGLMIPGFSAATTLAKVATGEKVSPMEIANTFLTGLDMAGVTKPPVKGVEGDTGTGLFNSTYGQTQAALNVAAAGDAEGAALALLGPQAVKAAIDKVPDDRILNVLQKDDVQAGLNKVVERVAGGAEFDEALAYGLGTYIKEGGGLNIEGTDVSLGVIEDVVRDIVRPIGKAGTALADFVEEAMPDIDTSALDPIEQAIRETGRTAEDIVRAGGKAVDKSIIQPTREVAKALDDAVTQPVGDALSALDTAIRQALPDIDLPDIDLPSMDLPFDLRPSLMSDTGEDFIPSPTRTTDSLFNDELFQFETEIGISDYPIEGQEEELELFYPESALQLDYAPDYDNFFENTIYEAKPRSYDF